MKKVAILLALIIMSLASIAHAQEAPMRILGLTGPTGMSLAPMMADGDASYDIQLVAAPEQLTGAIIAGRYDIAALPTNMAALLYQKTGGALQLLAINTLGVLSILEKGGTVQKAEDLRGKTITLAGQGTVAEYALRYVLDALDVGDTTLRFKSEHFEVSALAAAGLADLVMLPQPMASVLLMKDSGYRVALDMTQAFSDAAVAQGRPRAVLSMGCLVVRNKFAQENPTALQAFLADYAQAVAYVNEQPEAAAEDIVSAGILPDAGIARMAIPLSNIVFVTGDAMRSSLAPLFDILYEANPAAIGGTVPDDGFYFMAK